MLSQLETSQLRSRCCLNTLASLINSVKTQSLWAPGYGGQTATTSLARWDGALFHHGDVPPGQSCLSQPSFLGCSYGLDLVSAFNTRLLARTLIWPSVHNVLPTQCQWCSMCSPNPACYLFCKRIEFRIYMPNFPLPHPGIHRTTSVGFDQLEQFPVHFPAWEEIHPGNAFRESCRCTLMLPR